MNIQKIRTFISAVLVEIQKVVGQILIVDEINDKICRLTKKGLKLVELSKPVKVGKSEAEIKEAVLDGAVDLLYYIHFCLSRFVKSQDRTAPMSMANELYKSSFPEEYPLLAPELKHSFMWKMFVSEILEILIAFTSDYERELKDIVISITGEVKQLNVRRQLPVIEECIINQLQILGLPRDQFFNAFAVVHGANMSKRTNGIFIRDKQGKIVKPVGWVPGDLSQIVNDWKIPE
jgi:uncharacterized protein YeeX (DUF496 family)